MTWCDFWKELIIAFVPALLVIIAAIITFKQFYSQKWWEKKAEVYYKISEHTARLFFCISELYDHYSGAEQLSSERNGVLQNEKATRLEELKMILAGGLFIVSNKIYKELKKLFENLDNISFNPEKEPLADYIDKEYEAIKIFKESFNSLAKKDLKIKQ